MRNLLALVLTMLATNPFSISMLLLCVHNLLFPLSILLMCPRIFLNFVILVLIWVMRNMFNILGGSDETFESLGNFSWYDAALDPCCIYLVEKPRKIMWNAFFDFSFDFLWRFL